MNTLIKKLITGMAFTALCAATGFAGNWNANISSNQSYSGTAVIPSGAVNAKCTQEWACYLGTTICDGPMGNFTMNAGANPDSYDLNNETRDGNGNLFAGNSYPVYLDQYGSPSGSGYAGVNFVWM